MALLRGINVGKAKRIAMADLRAVVAGLGHRDVRTLLNSGNVVFSASGRQGPPALAAGLERAIESRLKVSSRVVVLTAGELTGVVDDNPLVEVATNPSRLFVAVLMDPSDRRLLQPLGTTDWSPDQFAIGARAAYLWCPAGIAESRLNEAVGRALGERVTVRNWATTSKLDALIRGQRAETCRP